MIFKNGIYFLLVLVISSCSSKKQIISFTEVMKGGHSNIEVAQSFVIKDQASLNNVFASINQTREPKLSIPSIDFESEMLIALFMGMKNSGGYSVKIDSIISKPKELVVFVKETKPKGRTTMVMTQPYYIAKIKKTNKTVVFK